MPTCADCYYYLGVDYTNEEALRRSGDRVQEVGRAEARSVEGYTGLANVYNAQKKFDLAAEVSKKAANWRGADAGAGGGAAGAACSQRRRACATAGKSAKAKRVQPGVILWNAGKFAEAKAQFEAAVKGRPEMAMRTTSSGWRT